MSTLLKKISGTLLLIVVTAIIFIACKKSIDDSPTPNNNNNNQNPPPANTGIDLTTKVNASVSGFVTNENNAGVGGASVQFGNTTTLTDYYGYFEIKNVDVVKTAAIVTVNKEGYFKGIKTFAAEQGKAAFFRIKLLLKDPLATIVASSGGNVNLPNGANVSLPADAIVTAAAGTAYSGTVMINASYIDPLATDLTQIIPGDQRAIDSNGELKGLTTFGMMAVELTSSSGELLQIAPGKKATLSFPMASSVSAAAPASIPLWYFDETIGLWKEDGTATKTGNTYVGDVSHFSYWNCDIPAAVVPVTFTVVDASGHPVTDAYIDIIPVTGVYAGHVGGPINGDGYVSTFVAQNAQYNLNIYGSCSFGTASPNYSQNFSVTTSAINLGTVVISIANIASVSGQITDCNNTVLTNGYILIKDEYSYTRYDADNTGTYHFNKLVCNGTTSVNMIAMNTAAAVQSPQHTYSLTGGNNNINIQACGVSATEFLNFSHNGVPVRSYTMAPDSIYHVWGNYPYTSIAAFSPPDYSSSTQFNMLFDQGYYFATSFSSPNFTGGPLNPEPIHFTEFGNIGEYMEGSWTAVYHLSATPNVSDTLFCHFRVRRMWQ